MSGGQVKIKELKSLPISLTFVSYALKMGVMCSVFQEVVKHISTGIYVYEFTSTGLPNQCVTDNDVILHKTLSWRLNLD